MHYLANVPWIEHFKKCLCPIISQNVMQVPYISIMHCSLPVISLLTCYQKEVMKACTFLYSQAARHTGVLTPPPHPPRHEHYLANDPGFEHFLAKDPPPPLGMSTFWLTSVRYAIDIQITFLIAFITTHIRSMAKVMFSSFLSFCPQSKVQKMFAHCVIHRPCAVWDQNLNCLLVFISKQIRCPH